MVLRIPIPEVAENPNGLFRDTHERLFREGWVHLWDYDYDIVRGGRASWIVETSAVGSCVDALWGEDQTPVPYEVLPIDEAPTLELQLNTAQPYSFVWRRPNGFVIHTGPVRAVLNSRPDPIDQWNMLLAACVNWGFPEPLRVHNVESRISRRPLIELLIPEWRRHQPASGREWRPH